MASVLETVELGDKDSILAAPALGEVVANDVPLFRFRLRHLLAFVAASCTLLAAIVSASGIIALALTIVAAVVAMHVFATILGHTLQTRIKFERRSPSARPELHPTIPCVTNQADIFATVRSQPLSPWHGRGSTYLPWLYQIVVTGMCFSALAGCILLNAVLGDRISVAGTLIGAISFGVLGGWFAFLCANFYGVFRHGFREAVADQQKDRSPRGQAG
jgi:hypothetical protein